MTQLTRAQAHAALRAAGWLESTLDIMTAVGAQESSLRVDVTGPKNADGTEDYGWLQINSLHCTGSPYWDKNKILSDPVYTAKCALQLYSSRGYKPWVAFTSGAYKKYMPPPTGPAIAQGCPAWFLVHDLQLFLNAATGSTLAGDGSFGPKTLAALQRYQAAHPVEPNIVGPNYWKMMNL